MTMQLQENSFRILLGLNGNSTEEFFLKNLYCLDSFLVSTSLTLFNTLTAKLFNLNFHPLEVELKIIQI